MRDLHQLSTHSSYKRGWKGLSGSYLGRGSDNVYSGTNIRMSSGRANSTPSNGILSTNYHAFRINITPKQFKMWNNVENLSGSYTEYCEGTYPMSNLAYSKIGLAPAPTYKPKVSIGLKNTVRTRALDRVNSAKIDLGESLGSIRQTSAMIYNTLMNLAKAFRHLLRGNIRGAAKALGIRSGRRGRGRRNLADDWLALQFGWKPLMNDIYNGVQSIKDEFNKKPLVQIRSSSTRPQSKSAWEYFSGTYEFSEGSVTEGCQVGITYQVKDQVLSGLASLNLLNPLHIAWQLLPLSFVYDWFVSVGSVLNALSANVGLDFLDGYETIWVKGRGTLKYTGFDSQYPEGTSPSWNIVTFSMERSKLSIPPKPSLYIPSGMDFNGVNETLGFLGTLLALSAQKGR